MGFVSDAKQTLAVADKKRDFSLDYFDWHLSLFDQLKRLVFALLQNHLVFVIEVKVFIHLLDSYVLIVHLNKLLSVVSADNFTFYIGHSDFFFSTILIQELFKLFFLN